MIYKLLLIVVALEPVCMILQPIFDAILKKPPKKKYKPNNMELLIDEKGNLIWQYKDDLGIKR